MTYLFADAWQTGQSLMASGPLRAAADRRSSGEMMGSFLALVEGMKRFEILCHLRQAVRLGRSIQAEQELEERMRGGLRVFDFGAVGQVQNNAVTATVLFLDLRGFTQTSEGHISEGDLTRALYAVFDAFVPIVRRFGGSVDKFLGDGMMVTFGTEYFDQEAPLNAVRAAILCQETIARLRREGKSTFEMGVSIHHGRVYVARFVEDEERVQVTVIGRNVNLAGRLSSASKKPVDDEASKALPCRSVGRVTVDADGALVNEGIVLSRAALVQIEKVRSLESSEEPGMRSMQYFDEVVDRQVSIRYVGDAKFKGVRASFPAFEVDALEAGADGQ
jgi:class 3 adenylate cyclase